MNTDQFEVRCEHCQALLATHGPDGVELYRNGLGALLICDGPLISVLRCYACGLLTRKVTDRAKLPAVAARSCAELSELAMGSRPKGLRRPTRVRRR